MTEPNAFFTRISTDGQYQRLLGRVDLFEETLFYTKFDAGRPAAAFEVSPADLATAFSGVPLATGLLPKNCLFYARSGQGERLAVYLPASVRTMAVAVMQKRTEFKIPLPPLVFVGQGASYWIHAVKQYPGPDEGLFLAPLPNVHNDGLICAGSVKFPGCSSATIYKAADAFFASDFNLDLAAGKSKKKTNLLELWEGLQGKDNYPVGDLVPSRISLADLVKGGDRG